MKACASAACSGVAVLPVPIAQTGSYATTKPRVLAHRERDRLDLDLQDQLGIARSPAARSSRRRTRSRRGRRRPRRALAGRRARRSRRTTGAAPSGRRSRRRRRARAASPPRPRRCRRRAPPSGRSARRPGRPPATTAAASDAKGGQITTSTPSGRSNACRNSPSRLRPLEHLPVGGDQHRSGLRESPPHRAAPCPRAARARRRRRSRATRRGRRSRAPAARGPSRRRRRP